MKATGIVRRMDNLGHVAIPKEIRRSYGLREGDPLEIYVEDDGIMLRKYDPTPYLEREAQAWLLNVKPTMDSQGVRFSIEGDTTTCEGITNNKRVTGIAKRSPSDPFSPAIGMIYAYCRAFGFRVPDFLT